MGDADHRGVVHVGARDIPTPAYLSPIAQACIAARQVRAAYPPLADHDAWRRRIAETNELARSMFTERAADIAADAAEITVEGVRVYDVTPREPASGEVIYLDIHGGALIAAGDEICRMFARMMAERLAARVWSVDYRMPPDHPFPAGLDDCVTVYRALLQQFRPAQIVVGGISAGGNLAAALLLRARDEGLPAPAAAVLISPEVDLTESGDSFATNLGLDPMGSLMQVNLLYAGRHELAHPYVSPLFGDFSKGFPPSLITAGTRDMFLSNAVRLHRALRAADVPAELHILEAAPHSGFPGSPEEQAIYREVRRFADRAWGRT